MDDRLPLVLTVEEAGEVLRIGRTKAYAMAREWRDTGGRSGLPVIDLGHVLRVPRQALEDLIGVELSAAASTTRSGPNGDLAGGLAHAGDRTRRGAQPSRTPSQKAQSGLRLGRIAPKPIST